MRKLRVLFRDAFVDDTSFIDTANQANPNPIGLVDYFGVWSIDPPGSYPGLVGTKQGTIV